MCIRDSCHCDDVGAVQSPLITVFVNWINKSDLWLATEWYVRLNVAVDEITQRRIPGEHHILCKEESLFLELNSGTMKLHGMDCTHINGNMLGFSIPSACEYELFLAVCSYKEISIFLTLSLCHLRINLPKEPLFFYN